MDQIKDLSFLNKLVNKFSLKGTNTNNYFLLDKYKKNIEEQKLFYVNSDSNACLVEKRNDYYKLYYFINKFCEFINLNFDKPAVMEILYRGETNKPDQVFNYWTLQGFKRYLTRDLLISDSESIKKPSISSKGNYIKVADSEEEMHYAKYLIDKTFDKYTGDILTLDEIRSFVFQKNILCAYLNDKPAGIYNLK